MEMKKKNYMYFENAPEKGGVVKERYGDLNCLNNIANTPYLKVVGKINKCKSESFYCIDIYLHQYINILYKIISRRARTFVLGRKYLNWSFKIKDKISKLMKNGEIEKTTYYICVERSVWPAVYIQQSGIPKTMTKRTLVARLTFFSLAWSPFFPK